MQHTKRMVLVPEDVCAKLREHSVTSMHVDAQEVSSASALTADPEDAQFAPTL